MVVTSPRANSGAVRAIRVWLGLGAGRSGFGLLVGCWWGDFGLLVGCWWGVWVAGRLVWVAGRSGFRGAGAGPCLSWPVISLRVRGSHRKCRVRYIGVSIV